MSTDAVSLAAAEESPADEKTGITAMRVITWFSIGLAVAAVGIVVGAELRSRYRFKKRTPYDFYSKAGQEPGEFGVGV
jgi:hypothetical protein